MTTLYAEPTGPESPHQQVARRLRGMLAERQITGTAVAGALGMDQRNFSRRLRGVTPFTFNELSVLAVVLGVPFAELVAHEPVENVTSPRPVARGSELYTSTDSNREPADYSTATGGWYPCRCGDWHPDGWPCDNDHDAVVITFPTYRTRAALGGAA